MEEAANNGISNLPDSLEALHINMEEAAKDMISKLPDSLLHHIISFLKIKDVARTSVLSKRWNYIWATVPTLDFQIRVFDPTSLKQATEKFMDFVDGTLHRHSGNVDKFALNWPQALNESRLHSWVSNVIRCKVKEIVLRIHQRHPLFIPLSFFTCESLISLELATHYSSGFTFRKSLSLPRLKRLNLSAFKFSDECWNGELFSNSPVLEDLVLQFCEFRMSSFCILIPTLKLLDIHVLPGEEIGLDCVFKIDSPRLISFSYSGYVAKEFILSSFPSLVEATVNTDFEGNDGAEEISRLLRAVAHVKCLTVSDKTLQAICSTSYLPNKLLTFHNVKNLNISDASVQN